VLLFLCVSINFGVSGFVKQTETAGGWTILNIDDVGKLLICSSRKKGNTRIIVCTKKGSHVCAEK